MRTTSVRQEVASAARATSRVWTLANVLTAFRIVLTLPFLYFVSRGRFATALVVFFIASLTDFFDGYVARRFNQQSSVGRFLDPLADKLLTNATYIVMAIPHENFPSIPVWLAIAVVSRDLVILAGSLLVYVITGFTSFTPTLLGKVNTLFELGLIVWFLVFNTTGQFTYLLPALYVVVLVSILASGLEYLIRGVLIVVERRRQIPNG